MAVAAEQYPARVEVAYPSELSRLMIFVKWLLAIPHYFALMFVGIAAYVGIIVAFFAVLITGRYPRGIFDFVTGTFRWSIRVNAYVLLLTDQYPPFSLADDPAYPARVEIDYPERIARWRPLVNWLLAIPVFIALYVIALVGYVAVFIGWFAILITGRMPEALFQAIRVWFAWQIRGSAYMLWMTERYPPFIWD